MAVQILGKVGVVPKGEYNNATTYQKLDVVSYNGQSYMAKATTIGNLPTDIMYWQLLVEKGQDGKTPIRGVDYWNSADKQEIENDVIETITPVLSNNLQTAKDYTDNQISRDFKDISYNENTATFIFTRHDNTTFTVDLPLEQTVKNGRYDDITNELVLVLVSNQEIRIPVSGLIDVYTGMESATIQVVINANNEITCNIKSGSISKALLTTELQEELNAKATKEEMNLKYTKPSTGIPKADMASDVQTSLGKADTALQEHQDISGKVDKSSFVYDSATGTLSITIL